MPLSTADPLYPVNSTTVDSGTGIDIRLLSSAEAGASDSDQTVQFTHTNDNVNRTFDPDTGAVTAVADSNALQAEGWALRLAEDMTPDDDINCNAVLTAGTIAVSLRVNLDQSGGTYAAGTYGPTFKAALFRYDPIANTGTLIASGSTSATTWTLGGVGEDLGTAKTATLNIVAPQTEFVQGEILLLQIGLNTGTVPNPTLGTATFTCTLTVDDTNTKIDFASGQGIAQVCYLTGSSSGVSTTSGLAAPVLPATGTSAGAATVLGLLEADKEFTGTSTGVATVSGALEADKETTGTSAGVATASGVPAVVVPTVGTSEVGAGGGEEVIVNPDYVLTTDGQLELKVADTEPYPLYQKL